MIELFHSYFFMILFVLSFIVLRECFVQNLTVSATSQKIVSIGSSFVKTDEVKGFHIYNSSLCFYIPSGIHEYFANIEVLTVNYCGLRVVTSEDFRPLNRLRGVYLQNNELTTLDRDLFVHNPLIEEINLSENKLKNIDNGIWTPLKNLRKVEILRNLCIDEAAIKSTEVEILIRNVIEKCPPKIVTHLPEIDGSQNSDKMKLMEQKIQNLEAKMSRMTESFCAVEGKSEL